MTTKLPALGAVFITVVVVGFAAFMVSFDVVDASHIGVKNRFGEIQGTMLPGMAYTGPFTNVEQYDLRTKKMTVEMMKGEQTAVDIDGQTVQARIEINYRLKAENVERMFTSVGRNDDVIDILNIEGIVREGFKTTTSKYKSKEIWQKRDSVKTEAISVISQNFPKDYVILQNVIISDLNFNPAFIAAIEQQKANEELALAKEKEVEIAVQEARWVAETARGRAEAKKVAAEASAYERTQLAEAQAYERLEIAKAEAEGLRLKREQLTALMVENNRIDAWRAGGAQVPQYVFSSGGGDGMAGFLLNIPSPDLDTTG